MVNSCFVPGCKSRWSRGTKRLLSFHEFPVKEAMRDAWISALNDAGFTNISSMSRGIPSNTARICGIHFKPDNYRQGLTIKALRPDAIPSVFPSSPPAAAKEKSAVVVKAKKAAPGKAKLQKKKAKKEEVAVPEEPLIQDVVAVVPVLPQDSEELDPLMDLGSEETVLPQEFTSVGVQTDPRGSIEVEQCNQCYKLQRRINELKAQLVHAQFSRNELIHKLKTNGLVIKGENEI